MQLIRNLRLLLPLLAGVAVIGAGIAVLVLASHTAGTSTARPQPAPTRQSLESSNGGLPAVPEPTPTLTSQAMLQCDEVMDATAYKDLITRVLDYEQAQLSPDSPAKESQLEQLATQKYMKDHPVMGNPTSPASGSDVTISVDRTGKSHVSCTESADKKTLYVSVIVTITTSAIKAPFTLEQPHATVWINEDSVWRVNQTQ